jgi:DNA-binding NtrC family response regulator/tetratricopeptide (TPR) repeat protein
VLQQCDVPRQIAKNADPLALAVLADGLQRVGDNDRAEAIVLRVLQTRLTPGQVNARCHFVLANINRDRGNTSQSVEHLQIAATLAASDLELSAWIHLRLVVVLAELSGAETAMARIDDVKRALTRFGDPRPFAALHLWLVEIEGSRGNLDTARQHLKAADSLLSTVDDVWLRGYLAINSSALHYYSAEISEAKRWAEVATACAQKSGHRATVRAANTNLGNIQFSLGNDLYAEQCFETALGCCEPGSIHQIAILDNIAQIRLHRGDLDGCRAFVLKLEDLIQHDRYAKRRHYNTCALHTKIRLLLTEGKNVEALTLSERVSEILKGASHARIAIETHLLHIEALLANRQSVAAADALAAVMSPISPHSPDLLAKLEHISARTLAACSDSNSARVHFERAIRIYSTLGHSVGEAGTRQEFSAISNSLTKTGESFNTSPHRTLDRIRALIDLRTRPELFGHEAAALIEELECASAVHVVVDDSIEKRSIRLGRDEDARPKPATQICIAIKAGSHRTVSLAFEPLDDFKSKIIAVNVQRIIRQILAIGSTSPTFGDPDIVWTANDRTSTRQGVIFGSDSMVAILRTVKQIAPIDISVLITGETGTGKEVIARTIHEYSRRSSMPFLALNCAAVPKDLLESQLFGHRKGAFSGAAENNLGIVRAANGGTLLLDEIGELPIEMQAKLLRFLEMSEVHPVGEAHPVKVDVRLIFATNDDLEEAVHHNRFRQDLYYRLNVIPIRVPPLRERREEIPALANLFAQRFAAEFATEPVRFSSSAMEVLILYSWPGNIRQLANEIRRLSALTDASACITPGQLSPQLQAKKIRSQSELGNTTPQMQVRMDQPLEKATSQVEAEMIKHALRQAGGRVSAAASTLGISRKGLYLKRLRLGLTDFNERAT